MIIEKGNNSKEPAVQCERLGNTDAGRVGIVGNVKDNIVYLEIVDGPIFDKDGIIDDVATINKEVNSRSLSFDPLSQSKIGMAFGLPPDIYQKLSNGEVLQNIAGIMEATKEPVVATTVTVDADDEVKLQTVIDTSDEDEEPTDDDENA